MNAIEVKGLSLQIDKHQILQNITVSFEQGQIHGLVGRNGSGKTMLMKCICGFVRPTAGTILVKNQQVGKDIDFPDDMGIIIETPGFIPQYSGLRNLKLLAALNHRIGTEQIRAAMRSVGLDPDMKRKVRKYSLGMRQRLGLAQAIMENPSILILDEPFNGLDKDGVAEMRTYLLTLRKQGKTVLIASHSTEDIAVLCDTVHEMNHGMIQMIKSGKEENNNAIID